MTVSLVAAATAVEATSIAFPAHQAGDFIVVAVASTGGTITVPAGWLVLGIRSAASRFIILAGKHAMSSSEVSGTWTGANLIASHVYRDPVNYIGFSGAEDGAASTVTVTYTLIDAVTSSTTTNQHLPVAAGIFVAAGMVASNSQALETPPTGYTFRSGVAGVAAIELAVFDTATEVASVATVSTTIAVATAWATLVVGLYDSGIPKSGGGVSTETSHTLIG